MLAAAVVQVVCLIQRPTLFAVGCRSARSSASICNADPPALRSLSLGCKVCQPTACDPPGMALGVTRRSQSAFPTLSQTRDSRMHPLLCRLRIELHAAGCSGAEHRLATQDGVPSCLPPGYMAARSLAFCTAFLPPRGFQGARGRVRQSWFDLPCGAYGTDAFDDALARLFPAWRFDGWSGWSQLMITQ